MDEIDPKLLEGIDPEILLVLEDLKRTPEIVAEKKRAYDERQIFVEKIFGAVIDQIEARDALIAAGITKDPLEDLDQDK